MNIYTDGSCLGNPGKGGWAYVHVHDDGVTGNFGSSDSTTNNIMEMTAIIEALEYASGFEDRGVTIFTDSTYCINGICTWMQQWKANGWKTSANKPVKNAQLWQDIDALLQGVSAQFSHVKGHSGDTYNGMADHLAREAAAKLSCSS